MHPFYRANAPYPQNRYHHNFGIPPPNRMIGNSQNINNRHNWRNVWYSGQSPNQFNYHVPPSHYGRVPPSHYGRVPPSHYGRGFQYGGGRYLPHQTAGPTSPVVAPAEPRPPPKANCSNQTSGPTNPVVVPEPSPLPKANCGTQSAGPNPVVAPEPSPPPKANCGTQSSGPNPVVAPEPSPLPKASHENKTAGPNSPGQPNPVVASEPRPRPQPQPKAKHRKQTAGPANPVVAPKPQSLPKGALVVSCRVCGVVVGSHKNVEAHNKGKKHQRMLILCKRPEKPEATNRQESGQIRETSKVPAEKPEGETRDNVAAQGHGLKRKKQSIKETRGDKYLKTNEGIRRPMESSKSDVNALSVAPPQGPTTALQDISPAPAVGSDFEPQIQLVSEPELEHEVLGAEAHNENQNPMDQTNAQLPSPVLAEFDAPATSSINTETTDGSFKAGEKMDVRTTELMKASLSKELESDPQIQLVLEPELEHEVLEAEAHNENQNPAGQTNAQLPSLPVLAEFDAPAASSINTKTTDGSFKAGEKMDVLTTELMEASLSKVNVCLKCGDRGFEETLVFCNKCQIYGLHRYCLDGPVIFHEDVTWFCEDCEPKIVGASDSLNLEEDEIQALITESTNCENQVEENEQHQQQNVVDKTKIQLSQRSNVCCEGENMFNKECQAVLKDAANSSEENVAVENSLADAGDGLNFVEPVGHVVVEPITDPIWRGNFCIRNLSIGTFSGILAHLSNLACSRVQEETRLLPEELSVDLLPRSMVWPKAFVERGTNHDSIALYLFPENERSKRGFDKLVDDFIYSDLAMRAELEHAELLVFPSTLLPNEYRRFQAKYYFWGVFRAKQNLI